MKIYLAGKVGGRKHQIAKAVPGHEYVCSDGSNHSEHGFGNPSCDWKDCEQFGELRSLVTEFSVSSIEECDLLFAYLDANTAYGSIAEIAYASGVGRPCFVLILEPPSNNGWPEGRQERFDAYWFVACLPSVLAISVPNEIVAARLLTQAIAAVDGVRQGRLGSCAVQ